MNSLKAFLFLLIVALCLPPSSASGQFKSKDGAVFGFEENNPDRSPDETGQRAPGIGTPQTPLPNDVPVTDQESILLPFGSNLFTGNFAAERDDGVNPDYVVASGDRIVVQTWGAVVLNETLIVDGQGNIFLPEVGPVPVEGRRNAELTGIVKTALQRVYRSNFGVYTNLLSPQPVSVYVTGFVNNPGRYAGLPTDSVLYFLDRADGTSTATPRRPSPSSRPATPCTSPVSPRRAATSTPSAGMPRLT